MTDAGSPRSDAHRADRRRWSARSLLLAALVVAIAFLSGFLWQYVEAREARAERDELRRELTFEELESRLAAAVIQAENDGYEGARELMSRFFTGLQSNVEEAPAGTRDELDRILARRDAVITELSRADPASKETLTRIFTRYQVAMGGPEVGIPIRRPRPADTLPVDTGEVGPPDGGADPG